MLHHEHPDDIDNSESVPGPLAEMQEDVLKCAGQQKQSLLYSKSCCSDRTSCRGAWHRKDGAQVSQMVDMH